MNPPRLGYLGDDFTGSTDAMESLELAGTRTVLFTQPPTVDQLSRIGDVDAIGIATQARALSPDAMTPILEDALGALKRCSAGIVHYKCCSTFDSSPTMGSIGRAIDVGARVFDERVVPVIAGTPALGRYCVFGNLFARYGTSREVYRIDRHPSMSQHPTTPLHEADLRVHLGNQTDRRFGLIDAASLSSDPQSLLTQFDAPEIGAMLIDLADVSQHIRVGQLLEALQKRHHPLYVVGSSAVEAAMSAVWPGRRDARFATPEVRPTLVVCGSCSPVTAEQIETAARGGFEVLSIRAATDQQIIVRASAALQQQRSVVIHTDASQRVPETDKAQLRTRLAALTRQVVAGSNRPRLLVAGGDTSGDVATTLALSSLRMIAPLVRGAPLCMARSTAAEIDGIEVVFKGGQIGSREFFDEVRRGRVGGET